MPAADPIKQILIVDRDLAAVEPLRQKLCDVGCSVRTTGEGSAAAAALAERPPHLLIIDWNMPGFAALEMIAAARQVRMPQVVRLIFLSALSSEPDVVAGFDLGADDYITKPFSVREAVARVFAVLRSHPHASERRRSVISCGGLTLDRSSNRVTAGGKSLNLRGFEYRILEFLMSNSGRTFDRAQILREVWGGDSEIDERTIDVNVRRLRKILAEPGYEAHIQTVRGFGYRFASPEGE